MPEPIDKVLESLNAAFDVDPEAMNLLLANRVSCNLKLARHRTIQVGEYTHDGTPRFTVTALGLINGVLGDLGMPAIAAGMGVDEQGRSRLVGFCRYVPPGREETLP